jgi:hypothetical protein
MTYYDAKQVVQRGTKINFLGTNKKPQVGEDKVLVGIVNNGLWAVAPDVTSDRQFQSFYDSYSQGYWLKMDVYALPKDEVENCPDQGKVPINDLTKILEEHSSKTEDRF